MPKPYEIDILQHDIDHNNPHWLTPEGGLKVDKPPAAPAAPAKPRMIELEWPDKPKPKK
jgi:hypothetical protein